MIKYVLRLPAASKYGVRAMFDLALHQKDKPISLREIAERQRISLDYLEHIFIKLRKVGLLESKRGVHGGFILKKEPSQIRILDIVTTLDGKIALSECLIEEDLCSKAELCVIRLLWKKLSSQIIKTLSDITLKDLIDEAKKIRKRKNIGRNYKEYFSGCLAKGVVV